MFMKKTLLILGAGASIPYGYPSGLDLVKNIIKMIEEDEIYFPLKEGEKYNFQLDAFNENNRNFDIETISDEPYENKSKLQNGTPVTTINPSNNALPYYKIKLNQIVELKELQSALIQYSPISIDNFLRDNPSFKKAGKLMIVYSLLKNEDQKKFEISNNENWYPYLLNDILHGCADHPENILKNSLEIITFNYDVSLDKYLLEKLSSTERLKIYDPKQKYLDRFSVHHVYGHLYEPKNQLYGKYFEQSNAKNKTIKNLKRFNASLNLKDNIHVMHEDRNEKDSLKKYLERNDEIIIIGFGFDRTNLDILGFPNRLDTNRGYNAIFPGKMIKYLNHEGKMTSLDFEFDEIKAKCQGKSIAGIPQKIEIIKSHAKNIIDAYSRDFKRSLII